MQRKPGFPVANCAIKMPDSVPPVMDTTTFEDDEQQKKRQQLINYGHSQWGFNNWSWSVSKQDLDFVDFANGKYSVGVVAFVSVSIKTLDIHRENIGYATTMASMKGSAIYQARKGAVTNALRETLLSFGSNIAIELNELLETTKTEHTVPASNQPPILEQMQENNLNLANKPIIVNEPKNAINNKIKPPEARENPTNVRAPPPSLPSAIKSVANPPAVAKAQPIPANLPPAANKPPFPANQAPRPPPQHRPNPNVSFVLQPVMGGVVPPMYAHGPPPRMPHAPPQIFPNYYAEYTAGPWHFTYEGFDRHHGNVNLNFNIPPKNLVVNSRAGSVECQNACGVRAAPAAEGEPLQYAARNQNQGCWIKPTIFYDGFWTEQKVKKWVAEQVEKQFPEDASHKSNSPNNNQPDVSKV